MKRRERLMATLNGLPVDRPPVSFYEINGFDENPADKDPYNIYSDPSWKPLIDLAGEKTDRILLRGAVVKNAKPDPMDELTEVKSFEKDYSRFVIKKIKVGKKVLQTRTRREKDVNTIWTEEHLLKNPEDLKTFLEIPEYEFSGVIDTANVIEAEKKLGDTGIVMIDTSDPLCNAAALFDMAEYTIVALTEPELFHKLLERFARYIHKKTEAVAKALPGRLWRIYGPEYSSPPYLPPNLFNDYAMSYDKPMIASIKKYGGFARIHSHGMLKSVLDHIAASGCDALDPIEPPIQGDVELSYVREKYGKQLVLFGNLEATDIENLNTPEFGKKVARALKEGTQGKGRGFVLMPSACPYGRKLADLPLRNYEKMIELVEKF